MTRILLIEDDEAVRSLLARMLTDAGYEVLEAADGTAGLKLYRGAPSELVITDLVMPEKEGIEVITELRRDFPDVKIIAITGGVYENGSYLRSAQRLGAHRTLAKPFGIDDFMKAVRDVLRSR